MIYKSYTTAKLAEHALAINYADLSDDILDRVEDCILDIIGCAIAGLDVPGTIFSRAVANTQYRNGDCAVWFTPLSLNATGAAFANSAAASMLDIDDGHRLAMGHPGAAVIPAALAMVVEAKASVEEFYRAIVAGYDVSVRLGEAEIRKSYHTGNWTVFGAAITATLLKKMDIDQVIHALSVSAYHGPRLTDLTQSKEMGSHVKESIPWSVVAGLSATELAGAGFTGSRDALDLENRFDPKIATRIDTVKHDISGVYFKKFSTCRWTHSSIEALLNIMTRNNLIADDIQRVEVETFQQAAALNNEVNPSTHESAQYSLPFSLGVAAFLGEGALSPLDKNCLSNKEIIDFASRVFVSHRDEMDHYLPLRTPAKVTVTTASAKYYETVIDSWGDANSQTKRADLREKFMHLAQKRMSHAMALQVVDGVDKLRTGDMAPLLTILSTPLDV